MRLAAENLSLEADLLFLATIFHKLKIALKELNETAIWLRIVQGSFAVNADFLSRLIAENTELCKILVASIQTAGRNDIKADEP
jgi:hypothetical protein